MLIRKTMLINSQTEKDKSMNNADLQSNDAAWHEARKGVIATGSRIAALKGLSQWSKPDDLMRQLVREYYLEDDPEAFQGNIATQWGLNNEQRAIDEYEMETGCTVQHVGFIKHQNYDFIGASPDGYVLDGLIEVKCPFSQKVTSIKDRPDYYEQIQLQMEVTNKNWCDFVTWTPSELVIERVERDADWLDYSLPIIQEFHQRYLELISDKELAAEYLEPLQTDMSNNKEWLKLESCYLQAVEELEMAKDAVDSFKQELLELTDDKKCFSNHLTVFKTEKAGSISYAKAIKKLCPEADFESYRGKSTSYWTVKVKK